MKHPIQNPIKPVAVIAWWNKKQAKPNKTSNMK